MRQLTASEVHAEKLTELDLDPHALDLSSIEAIAGALRRTASFLCPCTAATLIRNVVLPLRGLVDNLDEFRNSVEQTVEAMVAHGDILEHLPFDEDTTGKQGTLLYAAPPSFVARQNGSVILLGVAADHLTVLPEELERRVECTNHVRRLLPVPGEDLVGDLGHLGLIELSFDTWMKAPRISSASEFISHHDRLLDAARESRDIEGLSLLDPDRPVRYYRGRWVEPRSQSGRFVARRRQSYGADLWCYVELKGGHSEKMIDLPIKADRWRGCDEAWYLQMAIDASRGEPQRYRVRSGVQGSSVIELFSPVPMWARRRWDAIGEPLPCSGCLFAYRLPTSEMKEEFGFIQDALWLGRLDNGKTRE